MEKYDISNLSVTELKAVAYDFLAQIETAQRNLQIVNSRIAELSQSQAEETLLESVSENE